MSVHDEDLRALLANSMEGAGKLLTQLSIDTETSMEALITLMAAVAVMAKAMDLPKEALLEGVEAAYLSMTEVHPHATH